MKRPANRKNGSGKGKMGGRNKNKGGPGKGQGSERSARGDWLFYFSGAKWI